MMSDKAARLLRGAPYFPVTDVAAAGTYYTAVLGFTLEYSAGDPPEFAVYSRSNCPIMLRKVPVGTAIRPNEAQGGTWDVFYWVEQIDRLYAEFDEKAADVVYAPTNQPYGIREFAIRDPNGYVLGFGESTSTGAS
jgi:catechol 2,3-dioxygenase-like lactoylglutathione lyase family enzyme